MSRLGAGIVLATAAIGMGTLALPNRNESSDPVPKFKSSLSPSATSSPSPNRIRCNTSYAARGGVNFQTRKVTLEPNTRKTVRYERLTFQATYDSSYSDGKTLSFGVESEPSNEGLYGVLYQMGRQRLPDYEFLGGHGFTGLVYIDDPNSRAELQLLCKVVR